MMGSRIRSNPDYLYECFCEIVTPTTSGKEPWILQKYPETFNSEELLKPLPQFAHPCHVESTGVQHFSFVYTNVDSKWTYGFCRQTPDSQTSLCILSSLPWHETFYKVLNHIAELSFKNEGDLWEFLEELHNIDIPVPGSELVLTYGNNKTFSCSCSDHTKLPSIPENRNLTEYFNAIDATNMMTIFASMLYERRILITSKKLSRLSACIQAANSLIYPMHWQHIFIPVLPTHLLDYLSAPMPFLIGVPSPIMARVKKSELGEAVILDADNNRIESPFSDLQTIPNDIATSLKKKLKNPNSMLGDSVSRAFLRALVHLIGGYRDALKLKPGEQITFCDEAFIQSRPQAVQPFLEKMLQLQIFRQFIEERLDLLNSGIGFSDEFEYDINKYSEKSSIKLKAQYREWAGNMRKEGGALLKTVKNRTNPAVKHAYKSVKDKSKRAYKDIRTKFHDLQVNKLSGAIDYPAIEEEEEDENQPRSLPASPTSPRSHRPYTLHNTKEFMRTSVSDLKKNLRKKKENRISMHASTKMYIKTGEPVISKDYGLLDTDQVSTENSTEPSDEDVDDDNHPFQNLNMDLMGDLQDIIFRKCSVSDSDNSPAETNPKVQESNGKATVSAPSSFNSAENAGDDVQLLIRLDSANDDLEFDPLKSNISPSPQSPGFSEDIFRELDASRTDDGFVTLPKTSSHFAHNSLYFCPPQPRTSMDESMGQKLFHDNPLFTQSVTRPLIPTHAGASNENTKNEIRKSVRPLDLLLDPSVKGRFSVPVLRPIPAAVKPQQSNKSVDPFADLVSWKSTNDAANPPKTQWQSFN